MNNPLQSHLAPRFQFVIATLKTYHKLWLIPTIAGFALALIYVFLLRTESWSATQALSIRDDLSGQAFKPGRFDSIESMKSAQETILEIARKPEVIRSAMEQLGPASSGFFGMGQRDWPSEEMIEQLQGSIVLSAPNGAEFGETEVVQLRTKAATRQRSLQFVKLLLAEIIKATNDFRSSQLRSMQLELLQAHESAQLTLRESRDNINALDQELGEDLADMKALISSQTDGVTLKQEMSELALEKRTAEKYVSSALNALSILTDAQLDPQQVVNMSADLTSYVPGIEVLKRELAQQTRDLAVNVGRYSDAHPTVQNSKAAISEMKKQINRAIETAMPALSREIEAKQNLIAQLEEKIENRRERLLSLTERRAEVMILEAKTRKSTEMATAIEARLGEIEAQLNAKDTGLITPVGNPQVATRPDGLGKKAVVLGGTIAGLIMGLGMVMLVAPPMDPAPLTGNTPSQPDPSDDRTPSQMSPETSTTPFTPMLPNVDLRPPLGGNMASPRNSTTSQSSQSMIEDSPQTQPLDAELAASQQPEHRLVDEPQATAFENSPSQETDDSTLNSSASDEIETLDPITKNPDSDNRPQSDPENENEALPLTPVQQPAVSQPATVPANRSEAATMVLDDFPPATGDTASTPSSETMQTQILETETQQRIANTRPVDLLKSLEQESLFVRVEESGSTDQAATDTPAPRSNNPFLNPGAGSESSSSTTNTALAEETVAPESKPATPIPEQIRRLNESVIHFSNPVERLY